MYGQRLIEHAKGQERAVKDVLEELFYAMMELDSVHEETGTNTSFYIDFDEQDMYHAASIMYSVCGNYAIKHGLLTEKNATEKINKLRDVIKDTFGLDTLKEAQISALCNIPNKAEA